MNFGVTLIGSQLVLMTSAFFFDWPLSGIVRPVYRRMKSDGLRQIYQAKSLNFDRTYQDAVGVAVNHPSMYYDAAWSDWRQNTLQNNVLDSILLPWSQISVSATKNPIMVPGSSDPYKEIFRDRQYIEPEDEGKVDFKVGPAEMIDDKVWFYL